MPFFKGEQEIRTVDDWGRWAGPKRSAQWVADRSAMEVARAWLHDGGETLPSAVGRMLEAHPDFGAALTWWGEPEARLPFDAFAGEPRNSDVVVVAQDAHGSFVLAVEAKADETFGESVADTFAAAMKRQEGNPRSNGVTRVAQLVEALLGVRYEGASDLGDLRYQLLTATAGAMCEAERRGADRAIVFVHEFVTAKTDDRKHRSNAADLDRFIHRLSGGSCASLGSSLVGPFSVPGTPLFRPGIRLYFGKVSTNLRSGGAGSS